MKLTLPDRKQRDHFLTPLCCQGNVCPFCSLLLRCTNCTAGNSGSKSIVWYVFSDHSACTYNAPLANDNVGINNAAAANPAVGANANGLCLLEQGSMLLPVCRMCGGVDLYVWPKQHMTADVHGHPIQHHTVEIKKYFIAYANNTAIVAVESRLYPQVFSSTTNLLLQNLSPE